VTLEIELASERAAAARPQPAPDWMDPLETGAPNYD
jgi:hypothetical protein